ncbi:uncharacterized protein LOC125489998 [Plutella xylostella]|uniref:uncharacterized protein LOC125489998 n=1 Tax=Plutella xylostella TaxID=51655 RepID=UPI002032F19D|nr:uncharacterized protein LOC125489998 [Plutella xylostella]
MPVTRSTTGRLQRGGLEQRPTEESSAAGATASTATATDSDTHTPSTAVKASTSTGVSTGVSTPPSSAARVNSVSPPVTGGAPLPVFGGVPPPPSTAARVVTAAAGTPCPPSCIRATPPASTARSKAKSLKARRIAEAKEELACRQVEIAEAKEEIARSKEEIARRKAELAAARLAVIEAESDTDDDDGSISTEMESTLKVDSWLKTQQNVLAIKNEPHSASAAPPPPTEAAEESRQHDEDYVLPPPVATAVDPASTAAVPVAQPRTSDSVSLTALAEAIALAARAGAPPPPPPPPAPRHISELPYFSGAPHEWLQFKTAYYESAASLAPCDNMGRLRRCLKGRAKEAVSRLLITSTTPENVMKSLELCFGRPDSIALAELERLRALRRPTDIATEFCFFANEVSNIVTTLQELHRDRYLNNPEITQLTVEKLTAAHKLRWFDFSAAQSPEEPDLLKLSRFLTREASICGPHAHEKTSSIAYEPKQQQQQQQPRRAQRAHATAEQKVSCPVCSNAGHNIAECRKFVESNIDSRWQLAKESRLCFRCLRYRSKTHRCRIKKCEVDGCERSHHRLLHFVRKDEPELKKTEAVASSWTPKTQAYLKIVKVQVSGPAGAVDTCALLDDGSTVTLIDSDIAQRIGARGPIDPLFIEVIADTSVEESASRRVTLTLEGASGTHIVNARTVRKLHLAAQRVTEQDLAGCPHLEDIQHELKHADMKPGLLIGQDNWHLLMASEVRAGQRHQPVASRTPLGWVLHGAHTRALGQRVHYVNNIINLEDSMDEQLKRHFALDSLMITPKTPKSDPEQRALDLLTKNTIARDDGRYETSLLWKKDDFSMPNNYENTLKRLHSIEKKIDRDADLKEKYEKQMESLITKGYAEVAPPTTSNKVWYLPHFAVVNPNKGKIRIVLDAAATYKGVSLNDHLLTGPDLLQSLPGVLMRFRQHAVAVTADIAEMFMQVKIRAEDRDALRYLWRGNKRDGPPTEYRMTSLIFGATSSPSTAIYVKNINALKYEATHPEAVDAIINKHYVDDYLDSHKTEEQAIKVAQDVRDIHRRGHFVPRQWASNSEAVLKALGETGNEPMNIKIDDGSSERVLGLIWRPKSDALGFNLDLARLPPAVIEKKIPTKREALKIVMSLYDPLGFAAPVTVRAKQLLQEAWRRGTTWDQPIDEDLSEQWQQWMMHLEGLRRVSIPRCYARYSDATSLQLHIFVDASESAYAAALYWRAVTAEGKTYLSLVIAKARVAPLKLTSIPRLELQAAVMGCRMAAAVIEEHQVKPESKTFWTDSKTVLTWLKNGSRSYRPFVAHRIADIEENSSTNEWRWIPTKLNVADDATRDVPRDFDADHRWYKGPSFLLEDPTAWPAEKPLLTKKTGEEKTTSVTEKSAQLKEALPDYNRFSKWEKLLRATARVLHFIQLCRPRDQRVNYKRTAKNSEKDPDWRKKTATKPNKRATVKTTEDRKYLPLTGQLLREAEILLVRLSQQQAFDSEIEDLQKNRTLNARSRLRHLAVVAENGILLLKSRIGRTLNIEQGVISPAILDGNHQITKLWIDYTHRHLMHAGAETTVNECRQHYWILRLRTVVKMMIHRCRPCRIRKDSPPQPPTGDHPSSRLAHHCRPYTYTGLDYFGPLTVTVGRTRQKRYVALFTCLTTRAVHLELVDSLTTSSAVMALRRHMALYGTPTELWSDNGTNLRGADRELRQSIDAATADEAAQQKINWRYIPPGAPFMGGAWERLVRSVKTALYAVLNEQHPAEEVLRTLLAEAEYAVNSRPLTHVSLEPDDPEALTPNHFLLGGSGRVHAPGSFDDKDLISRSHWRASQRLADLFWARWLREYLPELQHRREPHGRGEAVKIGDIVMVADGNLPRNTWPKGVVTAVYPGQDGIVRTVDVQTKGGTLRRPTKKLVILPTAPDVPIKEFNALQAMTGGRDVRND